MNGSRCVRLLLTFCGALAGCGGDEPGSASCDRISEACRSVDVGSGPIADCQAMAHDVGTDEACVPIEADCVARCEAALVDGGSPDAGSSSLDAGAAPDAGLAVDAGPMVDAPPPFQAIEPCMEPSDYRDGTYVTASDSLVYDPPCVRVRRGGSVFIEANDAHPLAARSGGSPDNPIPSSTRDVSVTFDAPGFYPYVCTLHSAQGMVGVIQVVP